MRLIILFLLTTAEFTSYGQMNFLLNKTWAYKKMAVIYKQDTLVMFHADSVRNVWYIGRVSLALEENGIYQGTDINGNIQSGSWSIPSSQTIIIDKDVNQLLNVSSRQFTTIAPIRYQDNNISIIGTLLTVFYSVPDLTSVCESIHSGDWGNSATWSCGHEPTINDVIVIKVGHTVTISTNNAQAQRIIHQGGRIKFSSSISKIFVKGVD